LLARLPADLYAVGVPWLLIKFSVPSRDADAIADALAANGALSVSIEGATDEARLQTANEATPMWSENRLTGLFAEDIDAPAVLAAMRETSGLGVLPPYHVERLDDADWERAWRANYHPQQVAPNLWITPSWRAPPDSTAINVVLDPGLAFGTGTHPSTRLCLAWLAEQPLAGRSVLDYGCGSGILAIAALKLGAAHATAVDIDPQAVAVTCLNAAANGVAERLTACSPDAFASNLSADVVVANILSETLIMLAPELRARLAPNGRIALSGVLAEQAEAVRSAYAPHIELSTRLRDGWGLLAGRRVR
jgi:ribosomal protein L11 methyltransferase